MKTTLAAALMGLQALGAYAAAAAPNAVFALPADPGIAMKWVLKPLDDADQAAAGRRRFRLAIDGAGDPWFADGAGALLVNPLKDYAVSAPGPFRDFVWMDGGDTMSCTEKALGLLRLPVPPAGKKSGPRAAQFVSVLPLSHGECRLFTGGAGALYVVERNPTDGRDEIILLKSGNGGRKAAKLVSTGFRVVAVAGDGETTFVGAKRWIYKFSPQSKEPERFFDAKEDVTGLAYSAKTGLFYTTRSGVGFVDPAFQMVFLKSPDPEIVLRGTDLYIRLSQTFAVVKIAGADRFKAARWPEK